MMRSALRLLHDFAPCPAQLTVPVRPPFLVSGGIIADLRAGCAFKGGEQLLLFCVALIMPLPEALFSYAVVRRLVDSEGVVRRQKFGNIWCKGPSH